MQLPTGFINPIYDTEDSDDDVDSEPNKWKGEDDEDIEAVYVKWGIIVYVRISEGISAFCGELLKNISNFFMTVGFTVVCKVTCNNGCVSIGVIFNDFQSV